MPRYPNRLRELRQKNKLSQKAVARAIGLKQPTVNRHENENRSIDAYTADRYARFYGVSPYELFVDPDHGIDYPDEPDAVEYAPESVEQPARA